MRRYIRTASGAHTAMIATLHTIAPTTFAGIRELPAVGERTDRVDHDRHRLVLGEPLERAGIDAADTNAVDANTSGARIGNDAACAASAFAAFKPDQREHPRTARARTAASIAMPPITAEHAGVDAPADDEADA